VAVRAGCVVGGARSRPSGPTALQELRPCWSLTAIAELHPAQRIRDTDRSEQSGRLRLRPAECLECLATEGRRQRAASPERREMEPDELDLPGECGIRPGPDQALRIAQRAPQSKRVQRQHPVGRWRWCRSDGTARREEDLERRGIADCQSAAGPHHPSVAESGRANDRRHGPKDGRARSTEAYRSVNAVPGSRDDSSIRVAPGGGRLGLQAGSARYWGRLNTYPTPRTVWMNAGLAGSASIRLRSQWTWTSTVRVSPP
jgi:hypothetical protein